MGSRNLQTPTGTFYGVGVGPGDPELLTLKAQRVLKDVSIVFVPQSETSRDSFAYSIASQFIDAEKQRITPIMFPTDDADGAAQVWKDASDRIAEDLLKGDDVAFITEGDPMLFSTFSYVLTGVKEINPEATVVIIPGISSVMASAASSGEPLVTHGQKLAILPATYGLDDLSEATSNFDTVVLMKVSPVIVKTLAELEELGLTKQSTYVRRVTTDREKVIRDVTQIKEEDMDYFSLLIVRGNQNES